MSRGRYPVADQNTLLRGHFMLVVGCRGWRRGRQTRPNYRQYLLISSLYIAINSLKGFLRRKARIGLLDRKYLRI